MAETIYKGVIMGKPRFYWYGVVKTMIMQYPRMSINPTSEIEKKFCQAVEKAIADTLKMPDGELRVKAIKEIYFIKTKTAEGVAQEFFYNKRTIQGWTSNFVYKVGKNAGF